MGKRDHLQEGVAKLGALIQQGARSSDLLLRIFLNVDQLQRVSVDRLEFYGQSLNGALLCALADDKRHFLTILAFLGLNRWIDNRHGFQEQDVPVLGNAKASTQKRPPTTIWGWVTEAELKRYIHNEHPCARVNDIQQAIYDFVKGKGSSQWDKNLKRLKRLYRAHPTALIVREGPAIIHKGDSRLWELGIADVALDGPATTGLLGEQLETAIRTRLGRGERDSPEERARARVIAIVYEQLNRRREIVAEATRRAQKVRLPVSSLINPLESATHLIEHFQAEHVLKKHAEGLNPQLARYGGGRLWVDFVGGAFVEDEVAVRGLEILRTSQSRVLLMGPPGSGKTDTLRYLAFTRTVEDHKRVFVVDAGSTKAGDILALCKSYAGEVYLDNAHYLRLQGDRQAVHELLEEPKHPLRLLALRGLTMNDARDLLSPSSAQPDDTPPIALLLPPTALQSATFCEGLQNRLHFFSQAGHLRNRIDSLIASVLQNGKEIDRLTLLMLLEASSGGSMVDAVRLADTIWKYWAELSQLARIPWRILRDAIIPLASFTTVSALVDVAFVCRVTGLTQEAIGRLLELEQIRHLPDPTRIGLHSAAWGKLTLLAASVQSTHGETQEPDLWRTRMSQLMTHWLSRYAAFDWSECCATITHHVVGSGTVERAAYSDFLMNERDRSHRWIAREATPDQVHVVLTLLYIFYFELRYPHTRFEYGGIADRSGFSDPDHRRPFLTTHRPSAIAEFIRYLFGARVFDSLSARLPEGDDWTIPKLRSMVNQVASEERLSQHS